MTCAEVHRAIREGRSADPACAEHARTCEACAELLHGNASLGQGLSALGAPVPPSGRIQARIHADEGTWAALRRWPTLLQGLTALLTVAAAVLAVLAFRPRPDLGAYPPARMAFVLVSLSLVVALGLTVRLRPLHWPPRNLASTFALLVIGWPMVLAGLDDAATGDLASMSGGAFWPPALVCFSIGSAAGLSLLALLEVFDRRTWVPVSQRMLSAGLMGVAGNMVLQLHCPLTSPAHLMVGHAVVGLVWGLGAAALTWWGAGRVPSR